MKSISLAAYTIRVRNKYKQDYLILDQVLPTVDFLKFVQDYFQFLGKKMQNDRGRSMVIRVNTKKIKTIKREVNGIVETGEYGYESQLVDLNKGKRRFKRKVTDAEMLPFYFLISLPKNQDKGVVLLERFGGLGVSKVIRDSMNAFLGSLDPNLQLEFNPLMPDKLVRKILSDGHPTKLIFRRFEIPNDLADYFDTRTTKEIKGYVEFRVVASRNTTLPIKRTLREFISGKANVGKLLEINKYTFQSAKVQIEHEGKLRMIDLENFGRVRAYYDVTDEVTVGEDGHPVFSTIDRAAQELKKELQEFLYPGQDA